ncbi:MAG: tetratricopeptide repeat protein [Candidatus Omnitrophota bacterium]
MRLVVFLLLISSICFCPQLSYAQQKDKLEQAISLYQHENYEEALQLLKQLRQENPDSSNVAYYTGLTYKRLQDYPSARPHLEAAVTLKPPVKNAYIELIDLLYQSDQTEDAKKWIELARENETSPSQLAFFSGLLSLKVKDFESAIKSFDEAQELDQALADTIKYYKALVYAQSKQLNKARDIFREIITKDPTTDLAAFADEYMDVLSIQEKATRPFKGYLGYALQYDDNVILKPNDKSLSTDTAGEDDWRSVFAGYAEYNLKPSDFFGVKTTYSISDSKQFDLGFYDMVSQEVGLQPAFYLKNAAVSFPVRCVFSRLNDKRYVQTLDVSNLNNIKINKNQMLQVMFQYNRDDFRWIVTVDNDNKDSNEYIGSLGWFLFFTKNNEGFINLRYAVNFDDAKGNNWKYFGNKLTFTSTVPIGKKLKWSLVGDYYRQDYRKINTSYDKERYDNILTVSNLVSYEIFKDIDLQIQHTFMDDLASIGVYKYNRNIYSLGLKYRF